MKRNYLLAAVALTGLLLSSCSKGEVTDNSMEPGAPAKMKLLIQGDQFTKATLPDYVNESKITKGMVFVFRGTGSNPVLDGKASFDYTNAVIPVSVNITAGNSRHVYVVANIDNENDFASVIKMSDLYNLTTKYQLTAMRTETALGMSGYVNNVNASTATISAPVVVPVVMSFLGSRISIDWDATGASLAFPGFQVTGAYLLNVKSQTDYFSAPTTYLTANVNSYLRGTSDISTFRGSYLPAAPATNVYDSALAMANIGTDKGFLSNSFYVLENNSPAPTIVVIEATQGGNTYYYPIVINGDQNGSGTGSLINPGDKSSAIKRGNIYNVKAYINGLGNDDPYEPLQKGALSVVITTATWAPVSIDQEFN